MLFIRYFQLCWAIALILMGGKMPRRRSTGDLRNFARSIYSGLRIYKEDWWQERWREGLRAHCEWFSAKEKED